MIGAILGDIVGSIYEFDNIKTKDFELFDKECFFTDDSVMTVAVAETLYHYDHIDEDNVEEFKKDLIETMQFWQWLCYESIFGRMVCKKP